MVREAIAIAALQSGILFLLVWLVFRLVPSLSANTKAWIWRLTFVKPLIALLPFATIILQVLPATPIATTQSLGTSNIQISASAGQALSTPSRIDPILVLWSLGAASVAAYGLFRWLIVQRTLGKAQPIASQEIQHEFNSLILRANITSSIRLLSSDSVQTPFVSGGFRPAVVIPTHIVNQEPLGEIRMMLAHEIAHIARRDLAWFGLTWLVQSLFFFNPVVWVAVRASRLDHESATDRHALALAGVPTQTYAEMLLRATVVARTSIAPGVLPMSESYRTIHRRLEAMKYFQSKPSRWRMSAIGALAVVTVGLLPTYQFAQASLASHEKTVKPLQRQSKPQTPDPLLKPKTANAGNVPPKVKYSTSDKAVIPPQKAPVLGDKYAIDPTIIPTPPGPAQKAPAAIKKAAINPKIIPNSPVPTTDVSVPATAYPIDENITPSGPAPTANPSQPGLSVSPNIAVEPRSAVAPVPPAESATIDIEMQEGDIRQAVNLLFKQAKLSYIMEEGVQGKITLSLKSVPFNVCLKTLLDAVGASYQIEGPIYKIQAKRPI